MLLLAQAELALADDERRIGDHRIVEPDCSFRDLALGFLVGILPFLGVSDEIKSAAQPAVVYSYITGFVVYAILAKMGLEPKPVPMGGNSVRTPQRAKA